MLKLLNKINSDELLHEAAELLQAAFITKNMGLKYRYYNQANDIKKIAKIIWKYEEMKDRGDL